MLFCECVSIVSSSSSFFLVKKINVPRPGGPRAPMLSSRVQRGCAEEEKEQEEEEEQEEEDFHPRIGEPLSPYRPRT